MIAGIDDRRRIIASAASLAERWCNLDTATKIAMLQNLVHRIKARREEVILQLRQHRLTAITEPESIKDLDAEAGFGTSYFTRVFRLGFLAPDITKAIIQGRQPPTLTAKRLSPDIKLDPSWNWQRQQLGFS